MKLMNRWERWLIVLVALALFTPRTEPLRAAGGGTSARMYFQRSVDTPGEGPLGWFELSKSGTKQKLTVGIDNLPGNEYGLFIGAENNFDTNVVLLIAALNKRSDTSWDIEFENDGAAPPQLGVSDLDDLAGLFFFIGAPSEQTNISGCVTNVFNCETNEFNEPFNCETNISGCETNIIVGGVLFGEIPPLVAKSSLFNFKGKSVLVQPLAPPSVKAKGTVSSKFNATKGQSVFDIKASGLSAGQVYSIWLSTNAGGGVVTNIAKLELKGSGGFFSRDTRFGETLPMLSSTITNLSGFAIEIRDGFNDVHLSGTLP